MNKYKFLIGQSVKMKRDDRWVGEYEVPATIISYGNVFLNGTPTYKLKTINEEIFDEVSELLIMGTANRP